MAVDYSRSALLWQTSVLYTLLPMLLVFLVSTPSVHSQNIRLAGNSLNEGRLEVYHSGVWGTVCDDYFDYIDAGVVCNSLGRGYGYKGTVIGSRYGPGNGTIWLDDVHCVGTETSIAACTHRGWRVHNCGHSEDVSVSCGTTPVQHGPLSNADNFFFVADRYLRNVYQVDATSGATAQLLPFGVASDPTALAYDSSTKLLYWTDDQAHTINRYTLLTNSTTVIYRDGIAVYEGLAIDIRRQKLYYADAAETGGKVGELSTDGTAHRVLIRNNGSKPRAVVFDDDNRTLYWTDWGTSPGIYRSSVVNPARQTVVSVNLVYPNALAIDFAAGIMYWGDADLDKIEMANIDGTGRRLLWTETNTYYFAFTLHGDNIYVTDWARPHILRLSITARTIYLQSSATPFQRLSGIVFVPGTAMTLKPTTESSTSTETPDTELTSVQSVTLKPTTESSTSTETPDTELTSVQSATIEESGWTTGEIIGTVVGLVSAVCAVILVIVTVKGRICHRDRRRLANELPISTFVVVQT